MKNSLYHIAIVLVALATLTLGSCSKKAEDMIVGKWDVTLAKITLTGPDGSQTMDNTSDYDYFEFTNDNKCTIRMVTYSNEEETMASELKGTYAITPQQLIITLGQMDQVYNIDVMDDDFMIIATPEPDDKDIYVTQSLQLEKIK